MMPPAASDWPLPVSDEPPDEVPLTSVVARMVAASSASTVSVPAVTGAFVIDASTSLSRR